ncbi:cytochrome c oxidase subunit 5b-1, mitochondrial [Coffea eugenioides]|uniref:Cytochrome c oxidase subunit 5b-1, mitochondrial-like n=1 Tax=Coffea arabica TaxID=13443 RepID=A0A6P6XGP5_COFAR|nr:cytochrome c oxidase subunit 5b-1, mitochondrial-like [Coffea arabica]XP_027126875.1 cytochrome c oxidase subunit 5b-1, mitochondrial-like [Coffea arabica]XP_027126882.1 cytochrome c oxidase subunit 5b-1, mitochondrial-like [Coffea arabica]XP_027167734.1 cytochrome c oxidase subunit 5b-1, mitochondrial [Coffea eugenioides]
MWRRLVSLQLKTLSIPRSVPKPHRFTAAGAVSSSPESFRPSVTLFSCQFSTETANVATKKTVEDVMPIATGHEREELEAELEGKDILAINYPVGPFGTKEAPAVIQSVYNKRIVGCPGGEGEDEHDVVWFWLEKDKPHECPVCSQYFVLEVVGHGGDPEGHSDDEHH